VTYWTAFTFLTALTFFTAFTFLTAFTCFVTRVAGFAAALLAAGALGVTFFVVAIVVHPLSLRRGGIIEPAAVSGR
jgi:hypothetical protein